MTRATVRAAQANTPPKPVTAIPVTIAAVGTSTVQVTLPGGNQINAPRTAGNTYTVGGTGWALIQEPAVIAVIPTAS